MTPAEALSRLTIAEQDELAEAVECRRSFKHFVRRAWPLIEPGTPLVWAWYLDAICLHIEAFARGEIRHLIINVPPRHLKSKLVSVLFPAWRWTWDPAWRLFTATYTRDLTNDAAIMHRQIVESPWYQRNYCYRWGLTSDRNQIAYFSNTAGGHRFSTTVQAGTTGYGGDDLIFDDLMNAQDTYSAAAREGAARWTDNTIGTRRNDPRKGGCLIIAQRLHEEDPIGYLLNKGDAAKWQVLRLPSEFDPHERCVTCRDDGSELWRDPRTEAGELLNPERFGVAEIEAARGTLGAYGYAAQHQQRPAPAGGGMFKRENWRFWKPDGTAPDHTAARPRGCYQGPAMPLPVLGETVISVDCTFTNTADADSVSITVWSSGGRNRQGQDWSACRFLRHRVNRRMRLDETIEAIRIVCAMFPEASVKLVELAAAGWSVVQELERSIPGLRGEKIPRGGGKEGRAWAIQPGHEAGQYFLPDGAPYLDDFVAEFDAFPRGRHDDDVDSTTQALRHFASGARFPSVFAE